MTRPKPSTTTLVPGVAVTYAGRVWHVWALAPAPGHVWIARTDERGRAVFSDVLASGLVVIPTPREEPLT